MNRLSDPFLRLGVCGPSCPIHGDGAHHSADVQRLTRERDETRPNERLVYDDGPLDGSFDEIYFRDVEVHLERSDEHNWYCNIWRDGLLIQVYMKDAYVVHEEGVGAK